MSRLYADNAATTLSAAITTTGQTSISVTNGSVFPSPVSPDYFTITITQAATETSWEELKVTSRSGNTLTVVRGQENTTPATWASGDKCEIRWTANAARSAANIAQIGEAILDFGSAPGGNYASALIRGITDIKSNSQVDAWLMAKASSDHNSYEHAMVEMTVRAGNCVTGQGFEIIGTSNQRLSGQWAVQYVWTS